MSLRRRALFAFCAAVPTACSFPAVDYFSADSGDGGDSSMSDAVLPVDATDSPNGFVMDGSTPVDAPRMTGDTGPSIDGPATADATSEATSAMDAMDVATGSDSSVAIDAMADTANSTDASGATDGSGAADAGGTTDAAGAADSGIPGDSAAMDQGAFEAAPDAFSCDQDGDAHNAIGGICGGADCDDHDNRAYDGEPNYLTDMPTATTNGDWNCNHVIEPEFPVGVTCSLLALGAACDATKGFTQASVGCGQTGTLVQCSSAALLCQVGTSMTAQQGCK